MHKILYLQLNSHLYEIPFTKPLASFKLCTHSLKALILGINSYLRLLPWGGAPVFHRPHPLDAWQACWNMGIYGLLHRHALNI